mmetsp:Transcript_14685/g.17149  ORF Transcript_14685/g.17149 Transcript_14685/m.17149 type:complete len:86 (-) Transcript_14685:496-753(-)
MEKLNKREVIVGSSLMLVGLGTLSVYTFAFSKALLEYSKADELQIEQFPPTGLCYAIIVSVAVIPASLICRYIMWLGFKVFIHSS